MPIGFTFPIAQATSSLGYIEPTNDIIGAIESNVRALLLTNWGERLMHFDHGCNLREFLFEPLTKSLQIAVSNRIRAQLTQWMPFLTISGIYIILSSEDPDVQEPGFKILLQLAYGNVPITISQLYPPP